MFEPQDQPRIFGVPPGVDFASALVRGLKERLKNLPPHEAAKVEIWVNTRRMARRLDEIFVTQALGVFPKTRLITDLSTSGLPDSIPPEKPAISRLFHLTQLVQGFLSSSPDFAAHASSFALARSLVELFDEMDGEDVTLEAIKALDISDQSGHWKRALEFLQIALDFDRQDDQSISSQGRQRKIAEDLVTAWQANPPQHPILIAGSTGSRGTTHLVMQAAACLPNGAVILPGFDFDLPGRVWHDMSDALTHEDHPQFRFKRLLDGAGLGRNDVQRWSDDQPRNQALNRLVSLSLRPAPVTDAWLDEGVGLGDLTLATQSLTLVEAPSRRDEAQAIAIGIRAALEDGKTVAVITPDRVLTRRVAAALDRWDVLPDDSAGVPLNQSAPGRFLRQVAQSMGRDPDLSAVLALLKHPLSNSTPEARGAHLLLTRELELFLRSRQPIALTPHSLQRFAMAQSDADTARLWVDWLAEILEAFASTRTAPMQEMITRLADLSNRVASGPSGGSDHELWEEEAGVEAQDMMQALEDAAPEGGQVSPAEFTQMLSQQLAARSVRSAVVGDPRVVFLGTLEARVQSADLVILAGLNEGVWPAKPDPDPWLNRKMRADSGLLLPERRIGLSAHDYQHAICAQEVWITRALRDDDAQTVPSRWVNRLTNLLGGLVDTKGPDALQSMRERGNFWLKQAQGAEQVTTAPKPARRPSPAPPKSARMSSLSVTGIRTLLRDPYAIYAREILRLKPLPPLNAPVGANIRGNLVHDILEQAIRRAMKTGQPPTEPELLELAAQVFNSSSIPNVESRLWLTDFTRICDDFLASEAGRWQEAQPVDCEIDGLLRLDELDFELRCIADRVDVTQDGRAVIYDYKTGRIATEKQQMEFDGQLLIEAMMLEEGAFASIGPYPVARAEYLGVGRTHESRAAPLAKKPPAETMARLIALIGAYLNPQTGFTARRATEKSADIGDYDHLSRFGEWDQSDVAALEVLT